MKFSVLSIQMNTNQVMVLSLVSILIVIMIFLQFDIKNILKYQKKDSLSISPSVSLRDETIHRKLRQPNYAPHLKINEESCKKPLLLGREHRGGWYICGDEEFYGIDMIKNKCIVYSYGLGADWSFDSAAETEGCEVHGFDPTGKLWRDGMHGEAYSRIDYEQLYPSKKKYFHNWGLGAVSRATYPARSIPQDWPGLGDPQLSKTNTEPWEMRSLMQTFLDLGHIVPSIPYSIVSLEDIDADTSSTAGNSLEIQIDETQNLDSFPIKNKLKKRKNKLRKGNEKLINIQDNYSKDNNSRRRLKKLDSYIDSFSITSITSFQYITVLKIDIEGAEWDAIAATLYHAPFSTLLRKGMIRQLLLEFHWDPDSTAKNNRHEEIMKE